MSISAYTQHSLLIALGGGTGAWLRHTVGRAFLARLGPDQATAFPWATLTCNVAGSLAMGLLVGWMARHGAAGNIGAGENWRLFLGVGLLGGFTTFSSFSLEFALLVERGAMGHAVFYAGASMIGAIAGLFAGLALMRAWA
ncbi:MAG: fluoride efflux transporter CrcB [Novosphingobium sp.]|nr:fluoride efflux transporter CrcB [Novosphingobium sp.]